MSLEFFQKDITELEYSDIFDLVENGTPESYDLDYKEDYPSTNNKLAKLMVAFANSTGGYILIGIRCGENNNRPEEIIGVEGQEHSTKITQIALSHSQPKIWPHIKVIPHEDDSDKDIIIIRINEAVEPIMYFSMNDRDSNKFYIRINDKIEPADQALLRKLFNKENYTKKIRSLEKTIKDQQEKQLEYMDLRDEDKGHILLGFSAIPLNKNKALLDFNDIQIEHFVKNLYNSLNFTNPYGGMVCYDEFIRNFTYKGGYYIANYEFLTDNICNVSSTELLSNGIINQIIIFDTPTSNEFSRFAMQLLNQERRERVRNSLGLSSVLLAYLFMMFLKLIKTVFKKAKYKGKFILNLRLLSKKEFSIIGNYVHLGNSRDIIINKSFYAFELVDPENVINVLNEILKELMRFFGFNLDDIDRGINYFRETMDRYINSVFG